MAEIDRAPLLASFFIDVCKPGGCQIDVIGDDDTKIW